MRRSNREVNIFNMSLLDILCGALGAFCFMMLVLFPYWKPAGAKAEDIEKRYREVAREMEAIRKQLGNAPGSGDIKERLETITKNYEAQKNQLEKINKENEVLQMRRPMLVTLGWTTAQHNVDLYVRWRGKVNNQETPPPDPEKAQGSNFAGDLVTDCHAGPCSDVWMIRDMPRGSEYEVYYKFMDANGNPQPAQIGSAAVNHSGGFWLLPTLALPQPKTVVFLGVLRFDASERLTFLPQPEYAATFQEMNKERLAKTPAPK